MKIEVEFQSGSPPETLRGDLHLPDARRARGTLVLGHGLASERREFGEVPAMLAERGWAALAFDRRGHGRSTGERGRLSKAWAIEDNQAALAFLKSRADAPAPFGFIGHSMGAALGTATLAETPELEAAALVAPVCRTLDEVGAVEFQGYKAANALSQLKARAGLGPLVVPYKNTYPKLFHDRAAMERARKQGFLHKTISLANYDELLAVDASEWAKRVRQPTLVVVAEHDKAVQHASSRRVFENLAGAKRLEMLDGSGHSAFADWKAGKLAEILDAWFAKELSPK